MEHIDKFMKDINANVDFKYGLATDPTLTDDQIRVIVLASGFRNVTAHLTEEIHFPLTEEETERINAENERISNYYGREKGERARYTRFYLLKPEDLDNEVLISDIESIPTVRRTDSDLRRIRQNSNSAEPLTPHTGAEETPHADINE